MRAWIVSLLLVLTVLGVAAPAWAQRPGRPGNGHAQRFQRQRRPPSGARRRLRSPRAAARQAQQRFGGRVLSVQLERGARPVYRVKLLSGGVVRVVRIPAQR